MNKDPLVTVIIASYNHASYVEESILSVLNQSYTNIELLVVDDGSTDDSVKRILLLEEKHGFDFKVQKNLGLVKTLNDCIARAQGDLIAPLGSDDVMLPGRIATQVAYIQDKPEVGICAGNIEQIDAAGIALRKRNRVRPFRRLDFQDMFLSAKDCAPAPTLLFRRGPLEEVGGFDPNIKLEDLQVELKITHAGYYIDVLEDVLAKYRVHGANTYKDRRFMVKSVLQSYALFKDHPSYELACARYINSMFLKCAGQDKEFARELLRDLPLRYWSGKTLRGLGRLILA